MCENASGFLFFVVCVTTLKFCSHWYGGGGLVCILWYISEGKMNFEIVFVFFFFNFFEGVIAEC